jgi:hypothetical protein
MDVGGRGSQAYSLPHSISAKDQIKINKIYQY